MNELKDFGKSIFNYFLKNTSPHETFILHIDENTYRQCAKEASLSEATINDLLNGKGFEDFHVNNEHECLAIVALQIKIAYDIEIDRELISSYNKRLINHITFFHTETDVQIWYRKSQEDVWDKVSKLFKKNNRNVAFPKPKTGKDRYVQYPKSQRPISGIKIINYADYFIKKNLEPDRLMTFSEFKKLIFNNTNNTNNTAEESVKKIIFSFYNMWDGRSSDEIKNKPKSKRNTNERSLNENVYIKFDENIDDDIEVSINNEKINLETGIIPKKYLHSYNQYDKSGKIFVQDEDYKDWLPSSSRIDLGETILIITKQNTIPLDLEKFVQTGEVIQQQRGLYTFLCIHSQNRQVYKKFSISIKEETPCLELVGGLKVTKNTYYDFAKPIIKITAKTDSQGNPYEDIFIDSTNYKIENGIVKIPDIITCGEHRIKLWDSTDYKFTIKTNYEIAELPALHGWSFNYRKGDCFPSTDIQKIDIDGLTLKSQLQFFTRNQILEDKSILRPFIAKKYKFSTRFLNNTKQLRFDRWGL